MSSSYYDSHDKTQGPYSQVRNVGNRKKEVDIHELLKGELAAQDGNPSARYSGKFNTVRDAIGGERPGSGEGLPPAPPAPTGGRLDTAPKGVVDRYFYLDSDFKENSSSLENGTIIYDISRLNQHKPLEQIFEMEINDFFFPEITTGNNFPDYFFFRRLFLFIEEMAGQAVFAPNSVRYHFELGIQPSGIAQLSTRIGGNKFIFSRPFRDLSIATISFRKSPGFARVAFLPDVFTISAVPGSAPAQVTTNVPHGLVVASQASVFITNFASSVGAIDNNINSVDGHLLTIIHATTLEFSASGTVGFDFAGIGTAVTGQMLVGLRRIAFTIRFRSSAPEETNTIVPV